MKNKKEYIEEIKTISKSVNEFSSSSVILYAILQMLTTIACILLDKE